MRFALALALLASPLLAGCPDLHPLVRDDMAAPARPVNAWDRKPVTYPEGWHGKTAHRGYYEVGDPVAAETLLRGSSPSRRAAPPPRKTAIYVYEGVYGPDYYAWLNRRRVKHPPAAHLCPYCLSPFCQNEACLYYGKGRHHPHDRTAWKLRWKTRGTPVRPDPNRRPNRVDPTAAGRRR